MKKKILTVALAVALVAVLAVGSIAYFTDTDTATNTFTVGNVKIDLIESQLHRVNAGVQNGNTSNSVLWTPGMTMEGEAGKAADPQWTAQWFTDAQIKADAAQYENGYFAANSQNMVPGSSVRKCPYVINTGASDAYVRVRVLIPADLFTIIDNGPSMWTTTAMQNGQVKSEEVDYYLANGYTLSDDFITEVDGVEYYELKFTYTNPLKPGEMTFWNCWGNIAIDKNATSEQLSEVDSFDVLVKADAIQADGFSSAEEAFAQFK